MAAVTEKAIGSDDQFVNSKSPAEETQREYQRDVKRLVDMLSKLNPYAKEFVPSSVAASGDDQNKSDSRLSADAPIFVASSDYQFNYGITSKNDNSKDSSSDGSSTNHPNSRVIALFVSTRL